jgi:predicted GH43/DUF377 family glycosyl hydrolase
MNAGLVAFDFVNQRFTHNVVSLSTPTQLWLVFRASVTEWGPSDLAILRLSTNFSPVKGTLRVISKARRVGNAWFGPPWREDPRFIPFQNGLAIAYTVTSAYEQNRHGYQVWQRQGLALVNTTSMKLGTEIFPGIGNNEFSTSTYPMFEKNWQFFEHNDILHVVYSIVPLRIFKFDDFMRPVEVVNIGWKYHSVLRGSAPPVRVEDKYYIFVHTLDYTLHALTISAKTLDVDSFSRSVILNVAGNAFVCGAIFVQDESSWYLSMGVNDRVVSVNKIHHQTILRELNLLPKNK